MDRHHTTRQLRSALAAGVALLAGIAGVAGNIGSASAAPTAARPAARTAASTEAWQFIRYSCRTVTAGQVCVAFEGNGQPSTYRVAYVLKPKPGQWIRRAYWTRTYAQPSDGPFALDSDGFHRFCAADCPIDRTTATIVQPASYFGVYTFVFQTPQGSSDLSAGVTGSAYGIDDYCVGRVGVTNFLTTTSDGTVYLARRFHVNGTEVVSGRLTDSGGTVYTHQFVDGEQLVSYTSPTFYRGWTRLRPSVTNSGYWHVVEAGASETHRENGRLVTTSTYRGPYAGFVC